jgi:hypothetical protein
MTTVSVQITRYVDDHFAGFVECVLVDAFGLSHTFVEKVPVVSTDHLSAASTYPCASAIECTILREWQDATGVALAVVCTAKPWGIASTNGLTEFTVFASQLTAT